MATPPTQNFTELDFTKLKQNLKTYLSTRPEFVDFNFDGSMINLIIELLTYNTQQIAFYANMLGAEFFLDTAQRRESVVSRSQELGYVPRSTKAPAAVLDITLQATSPSATSLTIPIGTVFTTTINDTTFKFTTLQVYTSTTFFDSLGNRFFTFSDVEIVEGTRLRSSTVIDPTTISGIVIPNTKIDISRTNVYVAPSNNFSLSVQYTPSENITNINSLSTVFFTEEINDELFRFYFGDGILGKNLDIGNLVTIDYLVCNGSAANGASVFDLSSTISGVSAFTAYTTTSAASGGAEIEDKEKVRFTAPKFFATQNRCITAQDYVSIVNNILSPKSVTAWGGETNDPVALGYVFIAIRKDETTTVNLTDPEKLALETTLIDNYCPLAITPIVVDPDYIHLLITSEVKYNPNILNTNSLQLSSIVEDTIRSYASNDLGVFNQYFRYSKLTRLIDESDIAINNNNLDVILQKRLGSSEIILNPPSPFLSFPVRFYNPIVPGTVISNEFNHDNGTTVDTDVYFKDDGFGVLQLRKTVGITETIIESDIGTVNYLTGQLNVVGFNPETFNATTNDIRISVTPQNKDVSPIKNAILVITSDDNVIVNVVADRVN